MHKIVLSLLLFSAVETVCAIEPATPARLDEVAGRGSKVMPFNLEKTLHIFDKIEKGGLQQVIAKDANDVEQIELTRKHLADIAAGFAKGDFSGPQRIHGADMPGLKELSAGAKQVRFVYQDLPNGGQIEYLTDVPELVTAIHRFFDAQLSDHARHAMPGGHGQHHGHQP